MNAQHLFEAATLTLEQLPSAALGLAQLGQEELGKSFAFLSAFGFEDDEPAWKQFWKDWRHHGRKSYAAFLYEWLNPLRIGVRLSDGKSTEGEGLRASIPLEKEAAFYVNWDEKSGVFLSPRASIHPAEAFARVTTVLSLGLTAQSVYTTLTGTDPEFRLKAFSTLARALATSFVPQEEVPALLATFAAQSQAHAHLVADLRRAFQGQAEALAAAERARSVRQDAPDG